MRLDLGRNREAIEAYQEAVALSPGFVAALIGLAKTYRKLGRNREAIEAYREAVACKIPAIAPGGGEGVAAPQKAD